MSKFAVLSVAVAALLVCTTVEAGYSRSTSRSSYSRPSSSSSYSRPSSSSSYSRPSSSSAPTTPARGYTPPPTKPAPAAQTQQTTSQPSTHTVERHTTVERHYDSGGSSGPGFFSGLLMGNLMSDSHSSSVPQTVVVQQPATATQAAPPVQVQEPVTPPQQVASALPTENADSLGWLWLLPVLGVFGLGYLTFRNNKLG